MEVYPRYPATPLWLGARIVWAGLAWRRRSFQADSRSWFAGIRPAPLLESVQNLPGGGPGLVVCNHYYRPGFEGWWNALAISASVAPEIHWVISAERRFSAPGVRQMEMLFLVWVERVYGFFRMPAMPPHPNEARRRALAVRRVVNFARRSPAPLIGLAPEGGDMPGGVLCPPPPGAGRFLLELNRLGLPLYPVGICEEDGRLRLRAGPAFNIQVPSGLHGDSLDRKAAAQVMQALAALLPAHLRGIFAG